MKAILARPPKRSAALLRALGPGNCAAILLRLEEEGAAQVRMHSGGREGQTVPVEAAT